MSSKVVRENIPWSVAVAEAQENRRAYDALIQMHVPCTGGTLGTPCDEDLAEAGNTQVGLTATEYLKQAQEDVCEQYVHARVRLGLRAARGLSYRRAE